MRASVTMQVCACECLQECLCAGMCAYMCVCVCVCTSAPGMVLCMHMLGEQVWTHICAVRVCSLLVDTCLHMYTRIFVCMQTVSMPVQVCVCTCVQAACAQVCTHVVVPRRE
jgi:hypothetical protein